MQAATALSATLPQILLALDGTSTRKLYAANQYAITGLAFSLNQWNSWIITYLLNTLVTIYLNGLPVATTTNTVNFANSAGLYLGNGYDSYADAQYQDVRIWGRVLSSDEAKQVAAAPYGGLIDLKRRSSAVSVLANITASLGLTLDNILAASVAAAAIAGSASTGLANETLSGQAANAVAASGSGTVSTSASCAASVAVSAAASAILQSESITAAGATALAAALAEQLGSVAISGNVTVATSASLSESIDAIALNAAGTVASTGDARIAVLIETLGDVQLVAIAGNVVSGPFRVVNSQVVIPGAKQVQINTGGAEIVQITVPGAVRSQIIAENEV